MGCAPFPLGLLVATPGALEACRPELLRECLARHARGDWGLCDGEDAETNDRATREGRRLLSSYPIDASKPCAGYGSNCVWIITEADRSQTTLLLPDEY